LTDHSIFEPTLDNNTTIKTYPEDSITEQHIKEGLSVAYVTALAHSSGLLLGGFSFDYGLDGNFSGVRKNGKRYASNGFYLDFQLKASCNVDIYDDYIKYNLESKTYNDLVDTNVGTPRILILYKLPNKRSLWFNINESGIYLKECAWWCSLVGQKPTTNKQRISIKIPRSQVLTPKVLRELMNKVERGDDL
jgi:hypothetical protein